MRGARVAFLLPALALCAAGCTGKGSDAPAAGDRTLEKLRAEVDRANRGEAVGHPPSSADDPKAHLAGLVAASPKPRDLPLPERNQTGYAGPLAVKLAGLRAMHSVKAGKLELTTADAFLEVKLLAQNTGRAPASIDLSPLYVQDASGNLYGIADDAQRGAGTRALQRTWAADERDTLTLYFEVPPETVGHELRLVVPAGISSGVKSDLKLPLD